MAATSLKPASIFCSSTAERFRGDAAGNFSLKFRNFSPSAFISEEIHAIKCSVYIPSYRRRGVTFRSRPKFLACAFDGEAAGARIETRDSSPIGSENGAESQEITDDAIGTDASSEIDDAGVQQQSSVVLDSLQLYKVSLAENDTSKASEIESFLKTIEDEKIDLERKVLSLTEELSLEKDRVIRITADFDNFRKRTERERLSVVSNAQGEVVERLLQVLDNFERAKSQIKVETEAEEKISNSYQSIYKQFVEILRSLNVVPVETVGKPFDPMLHEAIMREDSMDYEDGIIIEEYRKGFQLGDRLLRPSMVKVSSGPGLKKTTATDEPQNQVEEEAGETSETKAASANE